MATNMQVGVSIIFVWVFILPVVALLVFLAVRYRGMRIALLVGLPLVILLAGFLGVAVPRPVTVTRYSGINTESPSRESIVVPSPPFEYVTELDAQREAFDKALAAQSKALTEQAKALAQVPRVPTTSPSVAERMAARRAANRPANGGQPSKAFPDWTAGSIMEADVYPSIDAALRAVGLKVIEQARPSYKAGENNLVIIVKKLGPSDGWDTKLVRQLNAEFPGAATLSSDRSRPATRPEGAVQLVLTLTMDDAGAQGAIYLACEGGDSSPTYSAGYVDKAWVDDLEGYAQLQGRGHVFVVGQSPSPASSPEGAYESARRAAVEKVLPMVESAAARRGTGGNVNNDMASIRNRLSSDPVPPLQADRFAQTFRRPYGTVYSAAVLFDASSYNVDRLLQYTAEARTATNAQMRQANVQYQQRVLSRTGAAAGLCAVVGLIYGVLAVVTRGYFTVRLRIGAVALLLAGGVLLVALMVA